MQKMETKNIMIISLLVLAAIVIIQNLTTVPLKVLFITIEMPRIIFYPLLIGIGFLIGFMGAKKK